MVMESMPTGTVISSGSSMTFTNPGTESLISVNTQGELEAPELMISSDEFLDAPALTISNTSGGPCSARIESNGGNSFL